MKFRSDVSGYDHRLRFYKGTTTPAPTSATCGRVPADAAGHRHVHERDRLGLAAGHLRHPGGDHGGTIYVASYHANNGHYSQNEGYFATTGVDNAPLHALQNGVSGPNGVYAYGAASVFPNQTFNSSNYWVDVVFSSGPAVTTTSLPAGTVGTGYSGTLAAGGGTPPYTWSITTGSLPTGLTLAPAGSISGTPTAAGTSTFTVQVSDAASPAKTASTSLSITITPPLANTNFVAPTANAPVTTNAGDNNGFETTPANAYLTNPNNSAYAVDANSGTGTGTGCTGTGKDKHLFYNYGFVPPVLPAGVTIRGIEVRLDALVNSTTSAPKMCVRSPGTVA